MFAGFMPIRRGILEHIRSGDLTHQEALAYLVIILEADCATGIWRGSAKALGPYNYSNRAARHILRSLHQKQYIKSFCRQGRRGNYIVLVNKFPITRGKWKGKQLDATKTLNPKELVFRVEVNGHEDGHESAPSQEGNGKGKGEKKKGAQASPSQNGFDLFWKAYPKKKAKPKAIRAWGKIKPSEVPAILASIEAHKRTDQWMKDGKQFVPHPATFLNERRWEDEMPEVIEKGGTHGTSSASGNNGRAGNRTGPHMPAALRKPIPATPNALTRPREC